ncbi:unnamed protein product [Ambrosiozyma monospora]|uniref:Unnamed protein product n=1 Tax=Ambrosiozyma monospora TaxID=43982 RepID=A0A9W7DKG0_AMBMO|nr:unnamed protein product [Ambrosiozyma monospora]
MNHPAKRRKLDEMPLLEQHHNLDQQLPLPPPLPLPIPLPHMPLQPQQPQQQQQQQQLLLQPDQQIQHHQHHHQQQQQQQQQNDELYSAPYSSGMAMSSMSIKRLITSLPEELFHKVWQAIILNNLTTDQICQLIGMDHQIDKIICSLVENTPFILEQVGGFRMVSSNKNKLFGVLPGSEIFKKLDNFLSLNDIKIRNLHVLYYPMTDETSYTVRNFIRTHCESININFDASSGTETAGGHDFGALVSDLNLSESTQGYNVDQQLNNHFNDSLTNGNSNSNNNNNNNENETDDSKNTKIKNETIDWNPTRVEFASGVKEKINRLIVSYNSDCKDDYIITSISHLQNWVSLNHNNKKLHVQIDRGATSAVPPTMIHYLQAMVHDDQGMSFSLGLGLSGGKLGFQFQSLSFAITKLKYTVGDNDTGLYWVNGLPNLKKLELVWDTSSSKNIQIAFIAPY